jgi:hypothetical protein
MFYQLIRSICYCQGYKFSGKLSRKSRQSTFSISTQVYNIIDLEFDISYLMLILNSILNVIRAPVVQARALITYMKGPGMKDVSQFNGCCLKYSSTYGISKGDEND